MNTPLETDSLDYDVLFEASKMIKNVDGAICEIGTRRGGSVQYIVKGLFSNSDFGRNIVLIDPYGDIEYDAGEVSKNIKLDYTNTMRYQATSDICEMVKHLNVNIIFMTLEDSEFMKRFSDGVPFYQDNKKLEDKYALVFSDGPHSNLRVLEEAKFFVERSSLGSVFVFDDLPAYDHSITEDYLYSNGFTLIRYGLHKNKASYVRLK